MNNEYNLKVSVRNNNILRAIKTSGYSAEQFSKQAGISYAMLNKFINLRSSPFDLRADTYKPSALKLCEFLNCLPEDLWTEAQITPLKTNIAEIEFNQHQLDKMLTASDPMLALETVQFNQHIAETLSFLPNKERALLEDRFGFNGTVLTLGECGEKYEVSKERIRQIESRALRRLRAMVGTGHEGQCYLREFVDL